MRNILNSSCLRPQKQELAKLVAFRMHELFAISNFTDFGPIVKETEERSHGETLYVLKPK